MSDEREILGYREAEYRRRCALAFKDNQGRTLENIPEGLVWRLVDALRNINSTTDPAIGSAKANERSYDSFQISRAALDSLHIKESKRE